MPTNKFSLNTSIIGLLTAIIVFYLFENGKGLILKWNHEQQQLEDSTHWVLNGYVINNSSKAVEVWSDGGLYSLAANSNSDRFNVDVDHIKDRWGQWYKIGPYTVTVASDGTITGYECKVCSYGKIVGNEKKSRILTAL